MKKNNSTAIATISTPSFEDLKKSFEDLKKSFEDLKKLISEGNFKILIDANPDLLNQRDPFNGNTALHSAAEMGNLEVVKYLIDEKGVDVNQANKDGERVLHLAAGDLEVVKYLIDEKKVDINQFDRFGQTTLHYAARNRNLEVVKYLIDEKKVDVNQADKWGRTALHYATGDLEVMKYLIDEKLVDVNQATKDDITALHFAAQEGHVEVVRYLIDEKKVDVNQFNIFGQTTLHFAAQEGHVEVVRYLIDEKGVDVNQADVESHTALDFAVESGYTDVVNLITYYKELHDLTSIEPSIDKPIDDSFTIFPSKSKTPSFEDLKKSFEDLEKLISEGNLNKINILIDANPDLLNQRDPFNGNTALNFALVKGNLEVVKYLIDEKGVDVKKANYDGERVLHLAAGDLEVVKYLIDEKKVDINQFDRLGQTALHWAARNRNLEVVKYLIDEKKVDVNQANYDGETALHYATGDLEVMKYLIDEKLVDVNQADNNGLTSLHYAVRRGHKDVVWLLLAKDGTDVNQANKAGSTALHFAAERGYKDVVESLILKMSPDAINQADNNGWTALHCSAEEGRTDVVELLLATMMQETINRATKNKDGWIAFTFDAYQGHKNGQTALHFAVAKGHKDVVALLLAKDGIDVNKANYDGEKALHLAAEKGHKDVVDLITYYLRIHNLTAQEPSIDKTIEDSFTFTRENGETETLVTADIFKKLLLQRYPDSASFEKYSNNLQILQTSTNKSSHPQLKDSLEKLHKIACEFKTESINKMDDVDLMLLQGESFEGLKMTFSQIKSQYSSLFSVVAILKNLQLQRTLIDSENISYQEFKKNLSIEDSIIIEDFLLNADRSTPFETIKKYIKSTWSITDGVKKAIEFYIENPEYQIPGQFLIKMIEDDKDELINALINYPTSKDFVLSLKNYILPPEIRKFIEELEQRDSMGKAESSSEGFEFETANVEHKDSEGVKRKHTEGEEDLKNASKEQKVAKDDLTESLERSIDDNNEARVEYTGEEVGSNTGDVFESHGIEPNNVVVTGDIGDSGTEG
jgi:ankyrin repeat protein